MKAVVFLLTLLVISSGYFINESFAEISENQAFLLEGSGFAVTEESIRISEIDLGLASQKQSGSTINFVTEDGFVTLDNKEFTISKLNGKFLRQGQYIRINGNIESSNGFDTSISFFGRLVEESKNASVYGFTGRITTPDDSYKVLYTTKLSKLSKITPVSTESKKSSDLTLHILRGSSAQKSINDLTPGVNTAINLRFFSNDRISVQPGTTITIVNDDVASHSIISGKENYGDRYNPFNPDGRISTGIIAPGESVNITFENAGFYRLYDPNYTWMKIIAYVFPNSDNLILGQGKNLGN
ncbi:MAG: plastocyanin/azurin family copper-binding protein [Nitrosopumilus sp.]|nr:plastocyanin/azurin family copper-binding protein [Nitrosopumilus sp.]MDH3487048.1 plastocyanin/azurin family copper-binding protein [Nitrosopumilus sp.]